MSATSSQASPDVKEVQLSTEQYRDRNLYSMATPTTEPMKC